MALKGHVVTKEHMEKMRQAKFRKFGKGQCIFCDKGFDKYTASVVTCGSKQCVTALHKKRYEEEKVSNPIRSQARRMTGSLRLLNKVEIIGEMISVALGKPCKYCGETLIVANISLDHKSPRHHSIKISLEEARIIDAVGNLQIVCRKCNQLKSDMNDEQFTRFIRFCDDNPDIAKLVKKRLHFARGRWQFVQSRR